MRVGKHESGGNTTESGLVKIDFSTRKHESGKIQEHVKKHTQYILKYQ